MTDTSAVFTTSRWDREPIFHESNRWTTRGPQFLCGRQGSEHDTYLRRDHAQRFGRPCKGCLKKGMPWVFRLTTSHSNWSRAS